MFDGNVVVFEAFGFVFGLRKELLELLGYIDLIGREARSGYLGHLRQIILQTRLNDVWLSSGLGQDGGCKAAFLFEKGEEQVLNVDLLMTVGGGASLGRPESFLHFLREAVEVHGLIIQPCNYLRQVCADFMLTVD